MLSRQSYLTALRRLHSLSPPALFRRIGADAWDYPKVPFFDFEEALYQWLGE